MTSSVSYRIAAGPQQGRKAFMIRTIRPLDRPDPGLERVAKANGFSLHAGVSCEGKAERQTRALVQVYCSPRRSRSPSLTQFHRQGGIYPEDALPGWNDPGSLRPCRFHCAVGCSGTEAEGQSHPLPRRPGSKSPLARDGHTSQTRQRSEANRQY